VVADLARQRVAVDAFLAAARNGDMAALLDVLDPGVVVRADAAASPTGTPIEVHGARAVAGQALSFAGRVAHARPALVDGSVGVAVAPNGRLAVVLTFALADHRITGIGIVAEPGRLRRLRLIELDSSVPAAPR
jgi:ketosteroid isomerase-like protein